MPRRYGFAFQFFIIPKSCLKAFLAIIGTAVKIAEYGLSIHIITPLLIVYRSFRKLAFNAFKNGDGFCRETIIVSPKHHRIVSIRSQHCHLTDRFT